MVTESVQESKPVEIKEDPKDIWVFTNLSDGEVVIQDLGYKSPGGMFSPEVFKPREEKDLAKKYSKRELRASKSLVIAVDEMGLLKRGHKSDADVIKGGDNALLRAATANKEMESAFQDPTRNVFDEKYDEMLKKEVKEDDRTKSSKR